MQAATYNDMRATRPRLIKSNQRGTPGVQCLFVQEKTGECIEGVIWLSDNALERSLEALENIGFRGDDLRDLSNIGTRLCQIVVAEEEFNGTRSLKVQWINANNAANLGTVDMDPREAAGFAAQMRAKIVGTRGVATRSAPPRSASARNPSRQALPPSDSHEPEPNLTGSEYPPEPEHPDDEIGF